MLMRKRAVAKLRRRRGTILIMVVALLVLLALMGTAWIASVATDREKSRAHEVDVRADMGENAIENMISAVLINDLMGYKTTGGSQTYFRPRSDTYSTAGAGGDQYTCYPWTAPVTASDKNGNAMVPYQPWLASRTPNHTDVSQSLRVVFWPAISAPLTSPGGVGASGAYPLDSPTSPYVYFIAEKSNLLPTGAFSDLYFESPYVDPSIQPALGQLGRPVLFKQRCNLEPTFVTLVSNGIQRNYPAFYVTGKIGNGNTVRIKVLAADADGSGVANAALWPLPGGQRDGVTWYAAIRIIDNSAAINANTAWEWVNAQAIASPQAPAANGGKQVPLPLPTNFFPCNIDLKGLLGPNRDVIMGQINNYRFGLSGVSPPVRPFNNTVPIADNGQPIPGAPFLYWQWDSGDKATMSYDAFWHQFGRRIDNPGYNTPPTQNTLGYRYTAFSLSDQLALAYHFTYPNPDAWLTTPLEQSFGGIGGVLDVPSGAPTSIDSDQAILNWYNALFDYASVNYSRRPLIVTRNPVSNQIYPATINQLPASMAPIGGLQLPEVFRPNGQINPVYPFVPVKTSLNTASFLELWIAYWNVMCDTPSQAGNPAFGTPFWRDIQTNFNALKDPYWGMRFTPWQEGTGNGNGNGNNKPGGNDPIFALNPARMFRSPIRNSTMWMAPSQVAYLRAAIAAANTIQLRQPITQPPPPPGQGIYQSIWVPFMPGPQSLTSSSGPIRVKIYPARPQPFISEVYANTNTGPQKDLAGNDFTNAGGYFAIELYNPYDFDIQINGWRLATIARTGNAPSIDPQVLHTIPKGGAGVQPVIVPSKKCFVLENYKAGSGKAKGRPRAVPNIPPDANNGSPYYVDELDINAINNKELVLLRPEDDSIRVTDNSNPKLDNQWVPVDQFDFTGMPSTGVDWHYVRNTNDPFRCVYPGRYDGSKQSTDQNPMRQQGTQQHKLPTDPNATDAYVYDPPITLGNVNSASSYPKSTFTIQIDNTDSPGPSGSPPRFPYGGFARVGDVMQVPFISAYRIETIDGKLVELNSLTMDSAFAEDTFTDDDPANVGTDHASENIGRFCPITASNGNLWAGPDWNETAYSNWRYRWAMRIFDYFTVDALHDDFAVDATDEVLGAMFGDAAYRQNPNLNIGNADPTHQNDEFERTLGVNGLININTAPWKVLAALPMVPPRYQGGWAYETALPGQFTTNEQLAQAIVDFRLTNGPYKTIFDLYRVPFVQNYVNGIISSDADDVDGDITPANPIANDGTSKPKVDGIKADYEKLYLFLNRISNMVTTRSDTFTCYVVIQGWRNAGSTDPLGTADPTKRLELVAERRAAFVVDRTGVIPPRPLDPANNNQPWPLPTGLKITPFPNE